MIGIGELARRTGVSVRMLRYYETEGLLRPERSGAGYRRYDVADVERARRIVVLNRAGLTLDRIRPLLGCAVPDGEAAAPLCPALRETIRHGIADLDDRIADLSASRAVLADLLAD